MLKKTIKFNDFNGTETEEDFYFNLSEAEAVLLEVARDGGKTLSVSLQAMVESKSTKQLSVELKDLISLSYGVRSIDGKRFEKSPAHFREFESSGAYHSLLLELLTDAQGAAHFINGIVPEKFSQDPNQMVNTLNTHKTARQLSEERMVGYNKKKQAASSKTTLVADPETTVHDGVVVSEAVAEDSEPENSVVAHEPVLMDVASRHPAVSPEALGLRPRNR